MSMRATVCTPEYEAQPHYRSNGRTHQRSGIINRRRGPPFTETSGFR